MNPKHVAGALTLVVLALLPRQAFADCGGSTTGGANQPPCTRTECILHGFFGNCLASKIIRTCDSDRLNLRLTLEGFQCKPCGGIDQPACDSAASCNAGGVNILGTCRACGDADEFACSGGTCTAGTVNVLGVCRACGDAGEFACSGGNCNLGTRNILGTCRACGDPGEVACDGGACNDGAVNIVGICTACGDAAQPACSGGTCSDRTRNVLGLCVACGAQFQSACDSGLACDLGLTHVGGLGEGRCLPVDCGGHGQLKCGTEPVCEPRHQPIIDDTSPSFGFCFACGGARQPQCRTEPACDPGHQPITDIGSPDSGLCLPCGGNGQFKCRTGPECQPRHQTVLDDSTTEFGFCFACGTAGQPFCRTLDPGCERPLTNIGGFCVETAPTVDEPTCNCTAVPAATLEGQAVWGFADLHAHQFANLAFGGVAFSGAPFDPDGITFALPSCGFTVDFPTVDTSGTLTDTGALTGVPVHGALHARDLFGFLAGNPPLLSNFGSTPAVVPRALSFEGWPRWNSPDHQRLYYRWLERAWRGGQRLMIVQAVNNELNCRLSPQRVDVVSGQGFGCSDMAAVDRQIRAAKDLETFIDFEHGGSGKGWYRIVYSAAQARAVMMAGKLAVVLGIEVDSLFDCQGGRCTAADVDSRLQAYYDMGVRHAYPIHLFDNDFGGAAYYFEAFNAGNLLTTGQLFQTYDCSAEGFEFRRAGSDQWDAFTQFFTGFFGFAAWLPTANLADCNARGLTPLGKFLVRRMMDRKMIVDVDHLSFRGVNDVLGIGEERGYPVIASHAYPVDLHSGTDSGERKWTAEQLRRLRDLGGVAASILIPEATNQYRRDGQPVVSNDCPSSSKEWAQRYLRLVELMSGGPHLVGVGYGSDFNGMTKSLAPRYRDALLLELDACDGDPLAPQDESQRVQYPFSAHGAAGTFDRQVTGGKTFDYNVDGVAHVGLIPDFVQDLKNIGLTSGDLEPFFRSAEAFLQMWERIDARGVAPPTTIASITPPANDAGWHRTPVHVRLSAIGQPGGSPVARVAFSATGAAVIGPDDAAGTVADVTIDAEGTTILRFRAIDSAGNQEPEQTVTIRIDRVPPVVSPLVSPSPNDRGWHRGDVTISLQGVDEQSGVAECEGPFALTGEGTNLSAAGQCTDMAGNASAALEVGGINIDRTPPDISAPPPLRLDTEPEGLPVTAPELAAFLAGAVADDALDAAPVITHDAPAVFGLGTTTVTFTAADAAGNTRTASATVTLKATPIIAWSAPDAIVFGTPLGGSQLSAAASVPGTFTYSPAAGAVLSAGGHTLSLTFQPHDTERYNGAAASVAMTVLKATPVLEWPAPAHIVYGTALGSSQLNAGANVAGTFAYTPGHGSILNAGADQALSVHFTPADRSSYNDASGSAPLTVLPAPLTITADDKSKVYGAPMPGLSAGFAGFVNGDTPAALDVAVALATTATTGSDVGAYPITAGGAADANYVITFRPGTLTITPAALTITADAQSMVINGTVPPLTASYSGFVNGDTSASLDTPVSLVTQATGAAVGTFPIEATAARDRNYAIVFVDGTLSVLYSTGACLGSAGHAVLPPVAPDGTSVFRVNRTVPVKFRVCDANGVSVGSAGVVTLFRRVALISGTALTPFADTVDEPTSDAAFRWDPAASQWILNLSTSGLDADATHVFRIALNDGSAIEFRFGLR